MQALIRTSLIVAGWLLTACTPSLHVDQSPGLEPARAPLQAEQADHFWWQLRFKLVWPNEEHPDFSQHLLIAEQIMRPLISQHEQQLPLWRFHRRAGRDKTGHQFSLIFYSDEVTAAQIKHDALSNPLTQWLSERQMIEKTRFHRRSPEELGLLEHTSDPAWPQETQRAWPYFIMGSSQSWLMLIQEYGSAQPLTGKVDYPALLDHYRTINTQINAQWLDYGEHAYLHHLNAIFGYAPIRISSTLQTF